MHTVKCAHLISKLQLIETSKREVKTTLPFLPFPIQTMGRISSTLEPKYEVKRKVKEMHYFQFMGNRTTLRRIKFRSSTQTEGNIMQHTHIFLFFLSREKLETSRDI